MSHRTFDPVGAFQSAREGALNIQAAEQKLAAQPARNQLSDLKLEQAKIGAERKETEFGQQQSIQRATILGQAARALLGLPMEQRDAAAASILPQLQQFGLSAADFPPGSFTDENLNNAIVQTQALIEQPAEPRQTSLQQNLVAAGLTPGSPEFQAAALKATTKPLIGAGEPEEQKALARLRVDRFGDIQKAADQATALLDSLNQLDAIDVTTGALEPAKASIAAVIEGFGIDASAIANATTAQSFNAISGRLVNDVLNAATGPQTDQDADRARKTIASLGDTPGAAVFKNNSLRAVALRQVEQRDFIAAQLDEDKNLSTANKGWREFKRKTPSLSSVVKGPNGLPVFFFQFKENAQRARPGISDQQIIDAWRQVHAR